MPCSPGYEEKTWNVGRSAMGELWEKESYMGATVENSMGTLGICVA